MQLSRLAALVFVLAAAACAIPVHADRVGSDDVYASIHANVLTTGSPSASARLVIERADLLEEWDDDPAAAIVALHDLAVTHDTRDRLYGLAELSLVQARETEDPKWYLGAAVYSFLYLFGTAEMPPPGPFDPRFRMACDLYAAGVAGAFRDGDAFRPRAGRLPLPVGELDVSRPAEPLMVGDVLLDEFESADDFEVRGMRSRVRFAGLGAPLIAVHREATESADSGFIPGHMPARMRMAATALLTIDGELADLAPGRARAVLDLSSPFVRRTATVRGQVVPLTTDITTPIAAGLGKSSLWNFELGAFLKRDDQSIPNGLILTAPYQPGKIPLVLVHGTASSPARWAELFNELTADPVIARNYQCWLFIYGTGGPILASAASLRDALRDTIQRLDPTGSDAALRRIVVAGHSQGGLLTRLMATSSGNRFWQNVSDEPFEAAKLEPDEREKLRKILFFDPVPQVERVIFMATPHRGSYVAGNFLGRIGSSLVSFPQKIMDMSTDAVTRSLATVTGDKIGQLPTAVDNMKPGSTFVAALADLPIDPRVRVNSIVAVKGDGPPEEGDDGVVAYEGAHWPSAESEIVVRSPHSCQGNPRTILEIRRVLREHAASR